jgi:flagellar basal-body rod protein FlgB
MSVPGPSFDPLGTDAKLLSRLLDAASLRHRVISSNIANASTPGFRRRDVAFDEQFARALRSGGDPDSIRPEVVETGEPVDVETELGRLTMNTLLYATYAEVLGRKVNMIRSAIAGRG